MHSMSAQINTKLHSLSAFFLFIPCTYQDFIVTLQRIIMISIMSATDYLNNAQAWLAQQSQRTIDYQWEIQHHNQMHKTYEKRNRLTR